jgi:hypothetical protein
MKTPEQIAADLVKVTRHGARVWLVTIGPLLDSYELMYDTEYVATNLAESVRRTIVLAIKESREQ